MSSISTLDGCILHRISLKKQLSMSQVDTNIVSQLKETQFQNCPSENKISIVITGFQDDPVAKATFYQFKATKLVNGEETSQEMSYRFSQLFEFNEKLIYNYGQIRILRLFPPKKLIGNKEADFVTQRRDLMQIWLNEICADEELCEDSLIRSFFRLSE